MGFPDTGTDPLEGGPPPRKGAWRRFGRFLPLLVIVALVIAAIAGGATRYLSLPELQHQHQALQSFVDRHPIQSVLCYMLVAMTVIALSLPGSLIVTLAGGYLFGAWEGAAAAVSGETVGAVIMYLVARSAFGEVLRRRARVGGLAHRLAAAAHSNAFSYLLTLRLIPGVPFFLVNLAAGFVRIRLSTYVAATVIGITPSTLIYASVGSGLGRFFGEGRQADLGLLLRPEMLTPLVALAVLAAAPIAYQIWRARRRKQVR